MLNLIEAQNLTKYFHGRKVVKGITMEIRQGEVLALIGPNGAGKSTTIAMLLGILQPDSGTVVRWRNDYRAHVGVQLQSTPFFEGYTVEENLIIFAALYHVRMSKAQILKKLHECGLAEVKNTIALRLSTGQQKRLAIAVTTVHHPDLIVLDEPTAGLDPHVRREIRGMIRWLAKSNVTVLFSSHDMEEVARTADRLILIHGGQVITQGSPEALLHEYRAEGLEELYLKLTKNA